MVRVDAEAQPPPTQIAAAAALGVATTVGTALLLGLPQSVTWLAAGVSAVVMVAIVVMSSIVVRTTDETVRRRRILAGSLLILGFLLATLGAVSLAIGWTAYGLADLWFGAVAVVAAFARLRDRSPTKPPPAAPPPGGPQ